jgi:hypothetical protein
MLLSVVAAVFVAGGVLGALVVLVLGIHGEERRMSVKSKRRPGTRPESGTRRVLGVGVRNPLACADRSDHDDAGR